MEFNKNVEIGETRSMREGEREVSRKEILKQLYRHGRYRSALRAKIGASTILSSRLAVQDDKISLFCKSTTKARRPEFISGPQKAFTLAEVLITLAIIGVVAALTIPTVVRNYQIKQYHTQLLKAQTVLSQALNMAIAENGNVDTWVSSANTQAQNALVIINTLKPYLKVDRVCGTNNALGKDCFYSGAYKSMIDGPFNQHPDTYDGYSSFRLADGMGVSIYKNSRIPCNDICGEILVDVNSHKPPNRTGVDLFRFYYYKNRIVPTVSKDWCSISSTNSANGVGCTKWFLMKENMDYLKKEIY